MTIGPLPVSEPVWFKSSYSGGNATECLEAAFVASGVLIRDSKHAEFRHLTVSTGAWASFLAAARHPSAERPSARCSTG
ncbi:DUF397 domain-containing protein [Streptomyces sp. NPDC057798]|uniref:DUF397 domain-containing protein n=1 Tax=Streptomyces sp. NPDC057798 TaxID=3346252 RepID=UPI0036ABE0FA